MPQREMNFEQVDYDKSGSESEILSETESENEAFKSVIGNKPCVATRRAPESEREFRFVIDGNAVVHKLVSSNKTLCKRIMPSSWPRYVREIETDYTFHCPMCF